jgi:type I restriction enzyme S subunit
VSSDLENIEPVSTVYASLEYLIDIEMGQAPSGADCNFDGNGSVFVKAGEFGRLFPVVREWTTKPLKFAKANDVLICVVGATAGKINLGIDCAIGRSVAALRPTSYLLQKYLYYFLASQVEKMRGGATGSAQGVISKTDLQKIQIPFVNIAEQQKIAQKLDELLTQVDTLKTRLDAIPNILKRFRQSVLAAAVSGRLTEDIPFEVKTLGDIIEAGPQNGIYKPSSFYGEGNRIVRIDGFYDGEMCDWEKIKRVQLDKDELSKWQLDVSDILINRVNSIEYLGKCALVRTLPEPAVFESNIMRIKLDLSQANPEYVAYFLSSVIGLERLRANAKLAVNQASINQTDVKNCQIELPSINAQEGIVRRVKQLFTYADQIEQRVKDAQARVNYLTQSILAKAFRGELTADWRAQNPELISGENSAAKLLERIKAEREKVGKVKRKAKA